MPAPWWLETVLDELRTGVKASVLEEIRVEEKQMAKKKKRKCK